VKGARINDALQQQLSMCQKKPRSGHGGLRSKERKGGSLGEEKRRPPMKVIQTAKGKNPRGVNLGQASGIITEQRKKKGDEGAVRSAPDAGEKKGNTDRWSSQWPGGGEGARQKIRILGIVQGSTAEKVMRTIQVPWGGFIRIQ